MVKASIGKKVLRGRLKSTNQIWLNQKGQMVIEAVLLMTLSVGLLLATARKVRQEQWMQNLVQGPWEKTAGMIESGVWEPAATAKALHPNSISRALTVDPDK